MPRFLPFLRFLMLFCGIAFPAAAFPAGFRRGGFTPPDQQAARPAKPSKPAPASDAARKAQEANEELERAVESAGNDRRVLVRNLRSFLDRFPDAPRREQVFRAIVEASLQLGDATTALEYAERLIALRPEDPSMMLLAVDLLERAGDDTSNTRAAGYITRVIDRIEKATDEDRPASLTPQEWLEEQKKLLMSLYLIRGRLETRRHRYDEAAADLERSYALLPNPGAAVRLGEIAEIRGQYERAIASYLTAFTLPEDYGVTVDRRQLRQKLGNVWRLVHASEAGLGEKFLNPTTSTGRSRQRHLQRNGTPKPRSSARSSCGSLRERTCDLKRSRTRSSSSASGPRGVCLAWKWSGCSAALPATTAIMPALRS